MAFKIGMVTLDCGPTEHEFDGDTLRARFTLIPGSVQEAIVLRTQLLGLNDPTARDVPIVWTDDRQIDGYYRVGRVTVDPAPVFLTNGVMRAEFTATALGYSPITELLVNGSTRTNTWSEPGAVQVMVPDDASWFAFDRTGLSSLRTITTENYDGSVTSSKVYQSLALDGPRRAACVLDPADYYNGGCRVEFSLDTGTTWWPLTGRELPALSSAVSSLDIRMSNGLTRYSGDGNIESFDGTFFQSGTSPINAVVSSNSVPAALYAAVQPAVLRNDPAETVLRFMTDGGYLVSASLQAGRGTVEFNVLPGYPSAATGGYRAEISNNENNASLISGGLEANADDSDGNRYAIYSSAASTRSTTGTIRMTSTTATDVGVFYGDGGISVAAAEKSAYFGLNSVARRVVA